jgi:hypothetical protein
MAAREETGERRDEGVDSQRFRERGGVLFSVDSQPVVLHIYIHVTTYSLALHIRNIKCSAYIVVHLYYYLSIKGYYKFV